MTVEQIEKFLANETIPQNKAIRFEFKKRDPIRGLIVKGRDYDDLKAKNFWRIVTQTHLAEWHKSQATSTWLKYSAVPTFQNCRW